MHSNVLRVVSIIFLLFFCWLPPAAADDHYAWVLVDTLYSNGSLLPGEEWASQPLGEFRPGHDFYQWYTRQDQRRAEFMAQTPRGRTINDPPQYMHGIFTWSAPPQMINPAEPVRFSVNKQVLKHISGGYSTQYGLRISLGHWNMLITEPEHIADREYMSVAFGSTSLQFISNDSVSVVFSREAWGAGREGRQREIRVSSGAGDGLRNISERYIYEWRQKDEGLSARQWILSFYVAYWNRAADPDGLNYWLNLVSQDMLDVTGVAENFAMSSEGKAMYPFFNAPELATNSERAAFVRSVYRNLLNREADSQGEDYWVNVLRTGQVTPGHIIGHIIHAAIQDGATDWLTIWNKILVAEYFTDQFATKGWSWVDSDSEFAQTALEGVTDNPNSVDAAKARVDQLFQ